MFIRNKNIGLRAINKDDLDIMKDWADNPDITKYMVMGLKSGSGCIYCSTNDIYTEYEKMMKSDKDIIFSIILIRSGMPIGVIGLYDINWIARNAELRICIGLVDYLGKGHGREAIEGLLEYGFNKLNLHQIHLGVNASDERANRCYKSSGFKYDGTTRDYHFRNGVYYNCNHYSILEDEWRKRCIKQQ